MCVSAALYNLHAMWQGMSTAEQGMLARDAFVTSEKRQMVLERHDQSKRDYLALLNRNPCAATRDLGKDYDDDRSFAAETREKLGRC